ncbi:DUF5695 domain-containing protein [Demequina sp. SYSU T00039]|uniref:DUF5695 domain-containing protein n=1 Tax=Demequina lignilytica TaxID=3051663 RepID=A0AAW7M4U5_9MICO|nr:MULTISPECIES: DUF5695 domain-containing protein [unclassified Demequina]MDN4477863.1 DUF5695 domain-containing protein [Demequina sp. SYSU T00039-1]MDN4487772.1 DUF5695 domain-containing protein [Demequina sp. SYSU T00039]MDN4490845.1 DUF5695 domain-containing protein [Demequina sp. SYSU T00068]
MRRPVRIGLTVAAAIVTAGASSMLIRALVTNGDAPVPVSPEQMATLSSDTFRVGIDGASGGVFELSHPADSYGTTFVANPDIHPDWDIDDSRWVGDLVMRVDGAERLTSASDDIRTVASSGDRVVVAYDGEAAREDGIRGFGLTETYALTGEDRDVFDWSITLTNPSSEPLTIEDLGVPMLMNAWWNAGDQTAIYEQNVVRHSYVAGDGSYAYWQRPNGEGPFLVMVPKPGTSLEFRDKSRTGQTIFGELDPAWEGLVTFAIHSAVLQPEREGKIGGYLPATSGTVPAGGSASYGFTFRWAADYTDLRDVLFDAGVVDVVSLPGMVVPTDTDVTLAVRATGGIEGVAGEDGRSVSVTSVGTRNGYELYRLTMPRLGPNKVTVTFDGGRTSVLQYYAIAPVETLIDSHARFLVDHQQARTEHDYDGAFLQWSMATGKPVSWHDYPGGGWKEWMAGGSDDSGLAPALYLARKNLTSPDQAEIDALDRYIDSFLLGYLQAATEDGERTWQVYRWYDGCDGTPCDQGVWRAYNYTHIANTYVAMYEVATTYPNLETARPAREYLDLAFRTLEAMFTKIPLPTPIGDAAHDLGLMGEGTYPEILAALDGEGMIAQAAALRSLLDAKSETLFAQKYPFASEASIDTTGFEASYVFAKMYDDEALKDRVQRSSLAARGMQPLWYYYGSDNRHMGESWWNLGYETQLGAWQQQDYLREEMAAGDRDFDESMRSTYGALLAGWANINAGQISADPANIGAASWQYQSQLGVPEPNWAFMPQIDGWWAWSGEADLGFWGGLRASEVAVVEDRIVGLYAYGGDLSASASGLSIVPRDGVRQRATFYQHGGFRFELTGARYARATVDNALTEITLAVEHGAAGGGAFTMRLSRAVDGTYAVEVDGEAAGSLAVEGGAGTATVDLPGGSGEVRLTRELAPASR